MLKITKVIDSFYNSKIGQKLANPKATVATAALIATVSNVSKDAVNCAYYTVQSLNNERIPDDQRKFVAALDLSNGLMNVGVQIAMAFGLSELVTSIFDNKLAKSKDFSLKEDVIREKFKNLPEELKKKMTEAEFIEKYKGKMKGKIGIARTGFTVLFVNIAMQILTKRIITPLAATPMASFFKDKLGKEEPKKEEHKLKIAA